MKLSTLKKKYKNKWILAEVIKEDSLNRVSDAKPIVVSSDREEVYKSLAKLKKGAHVTTIYTGQIPPKGMSFTLADCYRTRG